MQPPDNLRKGQPPRPAAGEPLAPATRLAIRFAGLWFLFDVQVTVALDGEPVGRGSVLNGFTLEARTRPGRHTLRVSHSSRWQDIELDLKEGEYTVELEYSRLWGNFCPDARVQREDY